MSVSELRFIWGRSTTEIRWYVTVLFMERSNLGRYVLLAIAVFFIVAGDYTSLFHHIKAFI
jgi:hypothetical protein